MLAYLAQLFLNGLITGAILALTGVGASLVFGIQRVANFAHGEYLTFAAYVALVLNVGAPPEHRRRHAGGDGGDRAPGGRPPLPVLRPLRGRGTGGAVAHHHRARAHAAERDLHRRRPDDPVVRDRPVRGLRPRARPDLPRPGGGARHHRRGGAGGGALPRADAPRQGDAGRRRQPRSRRDLGHRRRPDRRRTSGSWRARWRGSAASCSAWSRGRSIRTSASRCCS